MFQQPEVAKKLLSMDYKDKDGRPMTHREIVLEVNRIIPDTQMVLEKDIDRTKAITEKIYELEKLLEDNALSSFKEPMSKMSLIFQLKILVSIVERYLRHHSFTPQLEKAGENRVKLLKEK